MATRGAGVTVALAETKALGAFAGEMRAEIEALPKDEARRKAMPEPGAGIKLTPWLMRSMKLRDERQEKAAAKV